MSADQPQHPQQIPHAPLMLTGSDVIKLLEVGSANSINELPLHFYSLSALLPLANLSPKHQRVLINAVRVEMCVLKKAGMTTPESQIRLIEFLTAVLGQSSRALGGQERKELTTTRAIVQPSQPQAQAGGFAGLLNKLRGR